VETMNNRAAIGLLKIILGEALRRPAVASMINTIGPGRGIAFLRSYLERQMAAGTMRRMDSGAAARCFIGPLLAFVLTREVFQQPDSPSLSPETMVEAAVTIFLEGMRPDSSPEH
jgi:TetR/AcrR family transcriptional regulator, mexJK operon transcriptional repressor